MEAKFCETVVSEGLRSGERLTCSLCIVLPVTSFYWCCCREMTEVRGFKLFVLGLMMLLACYCCAACWLLSFESSIQVYCWCEWEGCRRRFTATGFLRSGLRVAGGRRPR